MKNEWRNPKNNPDVPTKGSMTDICICILWRRKENAKFLVNPQTERWEKTESGWKSFQDSSFDLRPSIGLTLQWLNPHQRSPRNDEVDYEQQQADKSSFSILEKRERKSHWKEMVLVSFLRHLITSFKIKYLSQKVLIILSLLDFSVHWRNS